MLRPFTSLLGNRHSQSFCPIVLVLDSLPNDVRDFLSPRVLEFLALLVQSTQILGAQVLDAVSGLRRLSGGAAHQFSGKISATVSMDVFTQPVQ